jgi:hypothetical protein
VEDFIIAVYCLVDEALKNYWDSETAPEGLQAKLI